MKNPRGKGCAGKAALPREHRHEVDTSLVGNLPTSENTGMPLMLLVVSPSQGRMVSVSVHCVEISTALVFLLPLGLALRSSTSAHSVLVHFRSDSKSS